MGFLLWSLPFTFPEVSLTRAMRGICPSTIDFLMSRVLSRGHRVSSDFSLFFIRLILFDVRTGSCTLSCALSLLVAIVSWDFPSPDLSSKVGAFSPLVAYLLGGMSLFPFFNSSLVSCLQERAETGRGATLVTENDWPTLDLPSGELLLLRFSKRGHFPR